MSNKISTITLMLVLLVSSATLLAAGKPAPMKEDAVQVKSWNHFSELLLALHKQQISDRKIKQTEKIGGYSDNPGYYREITYVDEKSGRLLSNIQWETENPDVVHSIQVYVYDNKGRLVRDYVSAYLPYQRNAPVQTLINLHHYNNGLHSFRQFDGSKDLVYEFCEGEFKGKTQQIRLFEDDLVSNDYETRQLFKSPVYKACFKDMSQKLGKFIRPQ